MDDDGHRELALKVQVIRRANNAIKHGEGSSLDWLIAHKDELWFRVREVGNDYLDEGDVSEIQAVVDTTGSFFDEVKQVVEACLILLPELEDWA